MAGNAPDNFEEEWKRRRLMQLQRKIEFIVLTSPTCPYCPRALEVLGRVAARFGGVNVREVSVSTPEGMALATKHRIMGVPTTLVDGKVAFVGVPDEAEVISLIRRLRGG